MMSAAKIKKALGYILLSIVLLLIARYGMGI